MTLIMTVIRPEGIWQSADYRVTKGNDIVDDAAPKQLTIHCPPLTGGPKVLLGFTGLAEMPDGTPTLQWIRETIRGESRNINDMLDHIRDRLTRDVGRSRLWSIPLILAGAVLESSGKRFYLVIHNFDPHTLQRRRLFHKSIVEIAEPSFFVQGSGRSAISKADGDLILTTAGVRPAKWEDYSGLLAAVNRRSAERDRKRYPNGIGTVSAWCQVTYFAEGDESAYGRDYRDPRDPPMEMRIEAVLAGIDLTEMTRIFLARAKGAGGTDQEMTDAATKGVEPRP